MKKIIIITIITLFIIITMVSLPVVKATEKTIIWSENFDGFGKDWLCGSGTKGDCRITPGLPLKIGQTKSDFIYFNGNIGEWDGKNPSYISGVTTKAARTEGSNNRGYRINLRTDPFPNGENILETKDLGVDANPVYLSWYERDSYKDFRNSSYQKLFRIKKSDGTQFIIPGWYGYGTHTYFRVGIGPNFSNSGLMWTNYDLNTDYSLNTWAHYELKIDIVNNKWEFFVNGTSKGEKTSGPDIANTSWRVRGIAIGGNQHNVNCWSPTTEYKTRDYDDIVLSTKKMGPILVPIPVPIDNKATSTTSTSTNSNQPNTSSTSGGGSTSSGSTSGSAANSSGSMGSSGSNNSNSTTDQGSELQDNMTDTGKQKNDFIGTANVSSTADDEEAKVIYNYNRYVDLDKHNKDLYVRLIGKLKNSLPIRAKYAIANFLQNGSITTKKLGAGERAGILASYYKAFEKMPQSGNEWNDIIKISGGHWPQETSQKTESHAQVIFKQIYKRNANKNNANDLSALKIMSYGIRPEKRNLNSEKKATRSFINIFDHAPKEAYDWDIVRSIAYSGAKR